MNMVHTTIETKDGWTRMVYHGTCVAEYYCSVHPTGHPCRGEYVVKLNTGGHFTKTTKKRMNQFAEMFGLPFRVSQSRGVWTVTFTCAMPNGVNGQDFDGPSCEFTVGV